MGFFWGRRGRGSLFWLVWWAKGSSGVVVIVCLVVKKVRAREGQK